MIEGFENISFCGWRGVWSCSPPGFMLLNILNFVWHRIIVDFIPIPETGHDWTEWQVNGHLPCSIKEDLIFNVFFVFSIYWTNIVSTWLFLLCKLVVFGSDIDERSTFERWRRVFSTLILSKSAWSSHRSSSSHRSNAGFLWFNFWIDWSIFNQKWSIVDFLSLRLSMIPLVARDKLLIALNDRLHWYKAGSRLRAGSLEKGFCWCMVCFVCAKYWQTLWRFQL